MGKESRILQWHLAFYAGVQLELEKEGSVMSEEFESLLNEKLAMREERGEASVSARAGSQKNVQLPRIYRKLTCPLSRSRRLLRRALKQWSSGWRGHDGKIHGRRLLRFR